MTVRLFNAELLPRSAREQRVGASAPRLLKAAVLAALGPAARRRGEVSLVFLGRAAMRSMNRRHLGHDHDTDVIAFRYAPAPGPEPGSRRAREPARPAGERPFGDIVISVYQARRQARELGHPLLTELLTLAAHGALHLAGYRDLRTGERRRMFARQDRVLRKVLRPRRNSAAARGKRNSARRPRRNSAAARGKRNSARRPRR